MVAGLKFRTTDNTKWGAGGGSGTGGNLTPTEADEDIWALHSRILAVEDNPPTAISIESFTVIGSQMQVNMSDGSTQGPYDLPIASFRMMGEWVNSMPLLKLDIITVPHDGVYMVNVNHTTPASPAVFDPEADVGRPIMLPAGLADCVGDLKVPPAADLSFDVQINDVVKGSVNFASGSSTATFTWTADVSMAAGDVVKLMKPATLDAAALELSLTFVATRLFDT
jgi:hypothetical protein